MTNYYRYLSALLFLATANTDAQTVARVMSMPAAASSDHIYKVRIESIDGRPVKNDVWHVISPGDHLIGVSLMLDVQWTPELSSAAIRAHKHEIELTVEAGKTYQLAARVDVDAPPESALDGSFWEPIVSRIDEP